MTARGGCYNGSGRWPASGAGSGDDDAHAAQPSPCSLIGPAAAVGMSLDLVPRSRPAGQQETPPSPLLEDRVGAWAARPRRSASKGDAESPSPPLDERQPDQSGSMGTSATGDHAAGIGPLGRCPGASAGEHLVEVHFTVATVGMALIDPRPAGVVDPRPRFHPEGPGATRAILELVCPAGDAASVGTGDAASRRVSRSYPIPSPSALRRSARAGLRNAPRPGRRRRRRGAAVHRVGQRRADAPTAGDDERMCRRTGLYTGTPVGAARRGAPWRA